LASTELSSNKAKQTQFFGFFPHPAGRAPGMSGKGPETILGEGRYLILKRVDGWEWVERRKVSGIAVIVAVTDGHEAVLVEQYRPPVQSRMLEWPAGLVGDEESPDEEHILDAANRELEEETGFRAAELSVITEGPPSSGQSSEMVTFIRATGLTRVGKGGGVGGEDIKVHLAPLAEIDAWLEVRAKEGLLIDPKIYTGLYFVSRDL
jgi:ADP-ribose pyrophosphatase